MAFFTGLAKGLPPSEDFLAFLRPRPPSSVCHPAATFSGSLETLFQSGFLNLAQPPRWSAGAVLSVAGICSGVGLCLNLCLLSGEESFRFWHKVNSNPAHRAPLFRNCGRVGSRLARLKLIIHKAFKWTKIEIYCYSRYLLWHAG